NSTRRGASPPSEASPQESIARAKPPLEAEHRVVGDSSEASCLLSVTGVREVGVELTEERRRHRGEHGGIGHGGTGPHQDAGRGHEVAEALVAHTITARFRRRVSKLTTGTAARGRPQAVTACESLTVTDSAPVRHVASV